MTNRRNGPPNRGRNEDYILEAPDTDIYQEHHAPVKRTARNIALGLLIVLALLTICAGFMYISYLMSPRGEYPFPL
jgi:hypothetical protein